MDCAGHYLLSFSFSSSLVQATISEVGFGCVDGVYFVSFRNIALIEDEYACLTN